MTQKSSRLYRVIATLCLLSNFYTNVVRRYWCSQVTRRLSFALPKGRAIAIYSNAERLAFVCVRGGFFACSDILMFAAAARKCQAWFATMRLNSMLVLLMSCDYGPTREFQKRSENVNQRIRPSVFFWFCCPHLSASDGVARGLSGTEL